MATHLLGAEAVHVAFPTKLVLTGLTLGVAAGDRIGVVGRNGDGKSTLLRILAGRLSPDSGQVTRRTGTTVSLLDQYDTLVGSDSVRTAVVGDVPDWQWAADPRIRDIVNGLVWDLDLDRPVSSLSGGQRRRVDLARILIGAPDVLCLDEPTNHLDVEGITWLARHLRTRWQPGNGALLVVTHDRWFLDEVTQTTWEVHDGQVEPFEGGYAAWVLQRAERARIAAAAETKRQNLLRKELAWLRRGAPARTSKPKFRIEAANQLIGDVPPIRDSVELSRLATARLGKDVIDVEGVSLSFGAQQVLRDVVWRIGAGDRFALLGANGAGKTTLLDLILGRREPGAGRVKRGKTVRLATLSQQLTELDAIADERISDLINRRRASYTVGGAELTPAELLERLGFTNAQLATPVRDLSGGQRRRLQLLLILLDEPNVLILDEPTNDMDTDMLAAMEDLLDTWPGTLVVASHDRYLLERVTDHQYALFDGRLRHLPGGVEQYLRLAAVRGHDGRSEPTRAREETAVTSGPSSAEIRAVRKSQAALERRMDRLTKSIDDLHEQLAAHDATDYIGLGRLDGRLKSARAELAGVEEDWLEVSAQLE